MKKSLILFLTIFSLNIGFVSNVFSMKRPHPESQDDAGSKRTKIVEETCQKKSSKRPVDKNVYHLLLNREIKGGRSKQFGPDSVSDLVDSRFNGNEDNDDAAVIDALIVYGYCVLEKIVQYLKINPKTNLEFTQDSKEFIKRWKEFFESDEVYRLLFEDNELDLNSSLSNWSEGGPLYILQPLKKHSRIFKNIDGKILEDQFEELKKICLEGIVDIVSMYFPIEGVWFLGNNLKHVPWYIFKLRYLRILRNNLIENLGDYAQDVNKRHKEEIKKFYESLTLKMKKLFVINDPEETDDESGEGEETVDTSDSADENENLYNQYWFE